MAADLSGWVLNYLLDNGIEGATADIGLAAMDGPAELEKALTGWAARRRTAPRRRA
jgi:hypothetical protein